MVKDRGVPRIKVGGGGGQIRDFFLGGGKNFCPPPLLFPQEFWDEVLILPIFLSFYNISTPPPSNGI